MRGYERHQFSKQLSTGKLRIPMRGYELRLVRNVI